MTRPAIALTTVALLFGAVAAAPASHQGDRGGPRDFAVGSGKNTFFMFGGPAHLMVAAHGNPGEEPTGHVRAKGDVDGDGPVFEEFKLEGEVTCLRVEDNQAAIKYRFKHATGFPPPFEGGGVQIFLEDNRARGMPDGTTFDFPQPFPVFDATASLCDDPGLGTTTRSTRATSRSTTLPDP
jgi:hypothetical protein